ncbi:MAG: hypothetical protein GY801_51700, partial [bacterium]|nr:hypothetical protein [bacterium]
FRLTAVGALTIAILYNSLRFPQAVTTEHSTGHMIRKILILPGFWLFAAAIFMGAGVESAFTFWSTSYVAAYLKDVPRAGAFAVVIFAAMMAIGRFLTAKLSHTLSLKMLMGVSALLGLAVSWLLPFTTSLFWFYVLLALAGLAAACFWPSILAEAAASLKVDATILFVMLSCIGIAGFGLAPWLLGIIGDRSDLKAGFSVVPGFFAVLLIVLFSEWRLSRKHA